MSTETTRPEPRFAVGDLVRVREDVDVADEYEFLAGAEGTVILYGDGSTDNPTWIEEDEPGGDEHTPDYAMWVDVGIKMPETDPITAFLSAAKRAHGIPETAWSFFEYELEAVNE